MTDKKIFAYGGDECDGKECPTVSAGIVTMDSVPSRVAGTYDEIVRKKMGESPTNGKGTIPEDIAKESWMQTIQDIRRTRDRTRDDDLETYYEQCIIVAEKVADHHGWNED